jgi:ribonuclease P/MRP protein subunit RPP1
MMKQKYYDLNVGAEDLEEKIEFARRLGWNGMCIVENFDLNFKSFSQKIGGIKENEKSDIDILTGARISTKIPHDIQKKSRDALKYADLILVGGGDENINRAASECWEVDVLTHPQTPGKDFMDQKNSGIDHITARFMAERCIALEIDFSGILNSWGIRRSRVIGKIRQNVMLARKYGVPAIITSGAQDKWSLRAPRELMAIGVSLGMGEGDAKRAVGENPLRIIKKSRDRKDPDVIMKGLEVVEWGDFKPEGEKRMFGWY